MGLLDRLFSGHASGSAVRRAPPSPDAHAIDRYRYMVRTAPPETLEQAHAEAFEQLTPEQRRQVLAGLVRAAPPNESSSVAATPIEDPQALARAATRAEIRQPGLIERTLGGGMGVGTGLLSSFMLGFAGSMVANTFFSAVGGFGGDEGDTSTGGDGETAEAAGDYTDDAGNFGDGGGFDGGGMDI